jgi:hypothetical protein
MAATEVVLPTPRQVLLDADDAAAVERWAQRRRAEVEHLLAELDSLRRAKPAPAPGEGAGPTSHLAVVDDLLRASSERLAARTADAIAAADDVVADAVLDATELLVAASVPGARLRPRDPLQGLSLGTRPARSAAELWRTVSGDVARPLQQWAPPRHASASRWER